MQCQCIPSPSPNREDNRDGREIFDFTSKKLSSMQAGSKTLQRKKDLKVESSRKVDSCGLSKSPRRNEDRSVFDFGGKKDSGSEGIYGRTNYSRREVLDFTSGND